MGGDRRLSATRKKGANKTTDRDLSVWYYATKELPHNQAASNLFKMQLYGDVLLVQQSRENSFIPRERFVSYTKAQYDDHFLKKRKRTADTASLAPEQYASLKESMQQELNQYESTLAATSQRPADTMRSKVPTADGKGLAQAVKARQTAPVLAVPIPHVLIWCQIRTYA